jgi:CRISPR-associated protein Csm4
MKLIKLKFNSALHLSRGKPSYDASEEFLHSDTLKSALFVAAQSFLRDKADDNFFKSFHVSSAFPFFKNELFFPIPLVRFDESEIGISAKAFDKVNWVKEAHFNAIRDGGIKNIATEMLNENPKPDTFYKREVTQRVRIPNDKTEESTPYFLDKIFFKEDAGLFFLLESDPTNVEIIEKAIKTLGKTGLGLQRNIGNGQFEVTAIDDYDFPEIPDANACLNLSLYCPANKAELTPLLNDACAYRTLIRGGWLASPMDESHITLRKKSITMFKEASVFGLPTEGVGHSFLLGNDLIDLTPEVWKKDAHKIWRDGKALFIDLKIQTSL